MPRIRPSRGHPPDASRARPCASTPGAIVPAAGGRTIFVLPWLGRTLIGTTDNDYEGPLDHVPPSDEDIEYLLEAHQRVLRHVSDRGRPDRRLCRRAAADLHRRPQEVGGHLAQGRAVRDELGPRDDHRRQAHHLAADGQAGRGPDRGARGARGALPHRGDPARDARRPRGAARTWTAWTTSRASGWPRATATPRTGCSRWPRALRSSRERIVPDLPDLLAEAPFAAQRGAGELDLRRAAAPNAARPARGQGADRPRTPPARRRWRRPWRAVLGWDQARIAGELEAWRAVAHGGGARPRAPRPRHGSRWREAAPARPRRSS